jgi:acetyltransferase-like isoleucine patch superfamily enzyme
MKYFKLFISGYYFRRFLGLFFWPKIASLEVSAVGKKCTFMGRPILSEAIDSNIIIGDSVKIVSNSLDTALGVRQPSILRTMRKGAIIKIGNNTAASGLVVCSESSVSIGEYCLIGANVTIFDTDFHLVHSSNRIIEDRIKPARTKPLIIGNNVFIGTGSLICKGVTIGNNSVIAAGSVVTKSFPNNSIIGGNPAESIGRVDID